MELGMTDLTGPAARRRHGPGGIQMLALQNVRIGYNGIKLANVFQYEGATGTHIEHILMFWRAGTGYSLGNGGNMRGTIRTWEPSTNNPDLGTELGTCVYVPNLPSNSTAGYYPVMTVTGGRPMTHGALYCVVWENLDTSNANYMSVNTNQVENRGRPMPHTDNRYWSAWVYNNGAWKDMGVPHVGDGAKSYVPIMEYKTNAGTYHGRVCTGSGSVFKREDTNTPTMRLIGPGQPMQGILQIEPGDASKTGVKTVAGVSVACGFLGNNQRVKVLLYQGKVLKGWAVAVGSTHYSKENVQNGTLTNRWFWENPQVRIVCGYCEQLYVPFPPGVTIDLTQEWAIRVVPLDAALYITSYVPMYESGFRSQAGLAWYTATDDGSNNYPASPVQFNGYAHGTVGRRWLWNVELHTKD